MDLPTASQLHVQRPQRAGLSRWIGAEPFAQWHTRMGLRDDGVVGDRFLSTVCRKRQRRLLIQWREGSQPLRRAARGERNFFYGINFELSYETPPFSQTRFASEIR